MKGRFATDGKHVSGRQIFRNYLNTLLDILEINTTFFLNDSWDMFDEAEEAFDRSTLSDKNE